MATARGTVLLTWTGATGSPGANIWHIRTPGALSPEDDVDAQTTLINTFYQSIAALYPTAVTFSFDGRWQGLGDAAGTESDATPWTHAGTATSGFLPPANCMFVDWGTSSQTRSGRGRTFVGPISQGTTDANGQVEGSSRTRLQSAASALVSGSQGIGNGAVGVYSLKENVFRDFTSSKVPNMFAVLRSRRD